jgi:hypothetical protein
MNGFQLCAAGDISKQQRLYRIFRKNIERVLLRGVWDLPARQYCT